MGLSKRTCYRAGMSNSTEPEKSTDGSHTRQATTPIEIPPYRDTHAAAATLEVFIAAITITAAHDYSVEQQSAWAQPENRELVRWNQRMCERQSLVAVQDDEVIGFSDVNADGYIDMMFVSPEHARQGVATALLEAVFEHARTLGAQRLWANVSITARPFFETHGFNVEVEQHPMIGGVRMTNFRMSRALLERS